MPAFKIKGMLNNVQSPGFKRLAIPTLISRRSSLKTKKKSDRGSSPLSPKFEISDEENISQFGGNKIHNASPVSEDLEKQLQAEERLMDEGGDGGLWGN